jgi:hypothetical protein
MYAIEFDTSIKNGIVQIPEYQELRNQKTVRLVVIYDCPTSYNITGMLLVEEWIV